MEDDPGGHLCKGWSETALPTQDRDPLTVSIPLGAERIEGVDVRIAVPPFVSPFSREKLRS